MQTVNTILNATDFSDLSVNAFHTAYSLARVHRAHLILLYVKQPQETIQGEFGLMPPEPEMSDVDILDKLAEMIPEGGAVHVECLVAHGQPADAIVQVAKEKNCELIVMGTHGRHGLGRLLHANVANRVTRAAPCPVLALRSSETEGECSDDDASAKECASFV